MMIRASLGFHFRIMLGEPVIMRTSAAQAVPNMEAPLLLLVLASAWVPNELTRGQHLSSYFRGSSIGDDVVWTPMQVYDFRALQQNSSGIAASVTSKVLNQTRHTKACMLVLE